MLDQSPSPPISDRLPLRGAGQPGRQESSRLWEPSVRADRTLAGSRAGICSSCSANPAFQTAVHRRPGDGWETSWASFRRNGGGPSEGQGLCELEPERGLCSSHHTRHLCKRPGLTGASPRITVIYFSDQPSESHRSMELPSPTRRMLREVETSLSLPTILPMPRRESGTWKCFISTYLLIN